MASTRNKNTTGNYILEQRSLGLAREYDLYKNAPNGHAYKPALPEFGFNPSTMGRDNFSYNSIDIETALFGINSTNLVQPQAPVVPQLKTLQEVQYFNRTPKLIMPAPLVIENNQRPFPVPN
jgi:hypothetical protein